MTAEASKESSVKSDSCQKKLFAKYLLCDRIFLEGESPSLEYKAMSFVF